MRPPLILSPLGQRDFALLWTAMAISLTGDGIYLVALAWQVYDLTDSPAALSLVGLSWSIGLVGLLLVAGRIADRVDRRRLMIGADLIRGACMLAMGLLAVTGAVEVWHLVLLSLAFGCAEAFFSPAFSAIIPQLVDGERLVQANALQEVTRPLAVRLLGPAIGGVLVALVGPGTAFLVDAASFAVAVGCVAAIRTRPEVVRRAATAVGAAASGSIREAAAWGRTQPWFWASLTAVSLCLMFTVGPTEVLLPLVVRDDLGRGAGAYGTVLAVGGIGGVCGGLLLGRRGLPARKLRFMLAVWAIATLIVSGYALGTATWQLAALAFVEGVGISLGNIVWATLMQTRTPPAMLGRASSLDWLASLGLVPVSFAVTGPVAALVGREATLLGAGLFGFAAIAGLWVLVPALRADDGAAVGAASPQAPSAARSSPKPG